MSVRSIPVPGSSGVIGPQSATGGATYMGFALRETSGSAPATIRIRSDGVIGGVELDTVSLTAGQSTREWYGPQGIFASVGLYFEVVAGAVEGSVRVA